MTNNPLNIETKLETSETFNRVVLESSPDCLKILDVEGRLQFMNFNGLCQMEIDDFSGFKNEYWWNLWGEEYEELVRDSVSIALSGKSTEFTAFCKTAKGTPKWWHVTITPVASAVDGIYQLLSISRDITELKNAEDQIKLLNISLEEKVKVRTEELLVKNIELEKTNTELAMFNYIASHDLQEPLRKIEIFSKMILDAAELPNESQNNFGRIIDAVERMRNLINALHQFSVSKNKSVHFEACDLNQVVSEIIEYSHEEIVEKNAIIEFDNLATINGSKVLITQLLLNLFTNALKYHKKGVPPQIKFSSDIINAEDLNIPIKGNSKTFSVIRITDNGIGFSNEYKHKIFDLFTRLHSKDEFSGTGIGLAICKTIVQNHSGYIEATSTPEVGSEFIIYFPRD